MSIKLIDSSIRDGGNVNDWNFGRRTIQGILENLRDSGIDIIELGYLRNVSYDDNRSLYNTVTEAQGNIPERYHKEEYSLMVQEDKWDWNKIEPCDGKVNHIRVSFHKYDVNEGLELCKLVKEYGYVCHCNPINIMGYSDIELLRLIDQINRVNPDVFTLVDTFGAMNIDDIKRINALLQNNLKNGISMSAHLHDNMGLAYSLAQEFISYFENKRDIYIDATLYGIGRTPGNLYLELIMNYLNKEKRTKYNIDYVYDAIDDFISKIKTEHSWGYGVPYALSAMYNLHRTYAEFLMEQRTLKTKDIRAILETIVPDEKVIYNQDYIQNLYNNYMDINISDIDTVKELGDKLKDKNILILAPGKTLLDWKGEIINVKEKNNCVVISVNFCCEFIESDYIFFTNAKRYSYERLQIKKEKVIITSNLLHGEMVYKYVVNYSEVSVIDGKKVKDSVLCLLNLLNQFEYSRIFIAGFDGFEEEKTHFDKALDNAYHNMKHTDDVKEILYHYFKKMDLSFVTPTIYERKKD